MKSAFNATVMVLAATLTVARFLSVNAQTDQQILFVEKIEEYIHTQFLPQGKVPGMGIAVVHNGRVYTAGHGYRNLEKDLPARDNTLFAVGSLSKMLSALAIVHFLNGKFPNLGEAVLDTPINQLAPNFKLVMSDRYRTEFITFRDILSHRVCIADFPFPLYGLAGNSNKADAVYQRRYAPEYCHFRNIQISYSNVMIHVAAEAAAAAVGNATTSFEQLAVAFYRQMGMTDIRFISDADKYEEIPNMSQPYYYRSGELRPMNQSLLKQVSPITSSGGILTSAKDMAQFINFINNRGKVGEVQLVKTEVLDWIERVNTPYRFTGYRGSQEGRIAGTLGYGIGMFIDVWDGYQRLGHTGRLQSYTSLVSILPALKAGIFTTASGPGAGPGHHELHEYIANFMLKGILPASSSRNSSLEFTREADFEWLSPQKEFPYKEAGVVIGPTETPSSQPDTGALDHSDIEGTYGQVLQGEFEITDVNPTTLYFTYGKFGTGTLRQRADAPAIYDLQFDTDLIAQLFYCNQADAPGPPAIYLDFSRPNVSLLRYGTQDFRFEKDWSLDQLPEIPWTASSCGPTP